MLLDVFPCTAEDASSVWYAVFWAN